MELRDFELFPAEWLEQYTDEQLERLAIMTVDGKLSDAEAEAELRRLES